MIRSRDGGSVRRERLLLGGGANGGEVMEHQTSLSLKVADAEFGGLKRSLDAHGVLPEAVVNCYQDFLNVRCGREATG